MAESFTVATNDGMMAAEVFNATPIDLEVWRGGEALADLPSLAHVSRSWPITAALELRPKAAQRAIGLLRSPDEGNPHLTIGPGDLHSVSGGGPVAATFVNNTNVYVDLYWVDWAGSQQHYAGPLAPGGRYDQSSYTDHVWAVHATFTGELLAMFVLGPEPSQTLPISGAYLARETESCPLPSPLPPIQNVALVGEVRERPRPESKDYIVISEHDNLEKAQFNTRPKVATRTVRIAGAKLIWDKLDDQYGLMSYQGEAVVDLEALEIYADHVVVASPLRFPRTNVTIYARELEFKGDGQIDTTPIAYKTAARSPNRTDDGHPANEKGEPTYQAANGLPGEPGGDLRLFVRKLTLPKGGEARKRFIARGSPGQQAEPGGRRRYKPSGSDQPSAETGKNLPAITTGAIHDAINAAFVAAKQPYDWRWPGEVDWPSGVTWEGKQLLFDQGGNVVDLVLVAHDDAWGGVDTNIFIFPPGERRNYLRVWDNAPISQYSNPSIDRSPRLRPGDGEDAYPGGWPGTGGPGGNIVTSLPLSVVEPLCDATGGKAGPETPGVEGGKKGGPDPAYWVQMDIVKKTPPFQSSRSPALWVEKAVARDGAPAEARRGQDGVTHGPTAEARSWLQPEVIDAVLTCARDAYRNGHRDLARLLLEPYYAELRSAETPSEDLQARTVSIEAIRANLLNNLDYYGNPPGWLPRLRLSTNFEIFQKVRQLSTTLLYYGLTTEQKYDTLEHADELARQTSDVLVQELDFCVGALKDAYTDLAQTRLELESVREKTLAKRAEFDLLKSLTEQEALQSVERQRIFRGVCKMIGGAMKVVPVGQPYLGFAGDVASNVGDINFTDPEAIPKQVGMALGKIGGATDKFLSSNTDLLVEDRVKGLRDKLKLDQGNVDDLSEQLTRTKSASANLEKAITANSKEIQSDWKNERAGELAQLNQMLSAVENKITLFSAKSEADLTDAERKQRQAAREAAERLKRQLGETEAGTLTRQRARLTREIEWLKREIAEEEAAAKANTAKANEKRKEQLEQEKQQLETFKQKVDGLEERQRAAKRTLTEDTEEYKTQQQEWKQTFNRLKGMGSGIGMIGEAVATLGTPATTNDPDVQAFAKTLLTSEKREEYQRVLGEFEALGKSQSAAMAKLVRAQQAIGTNVARVSENLTTQNALSRQQQSLEGVLDVRTKRYLRGMQERARDMLRWSVYNLVMSYRYEFLRDVSDSFYNFDKVVDALRSLESASSQGGPPRILAPDRFKAVDDTVLLNELLGETRKILEEREHRAGSAWQNVAVLELTEQQREELRITGRLTFNLVRDLHAGSLNWVDARIVDINLDQLGLEPTDSSRSLSLRATFRHSGESIILGRDERTKQWTYYYFRAAPGDDPIEWGFSYNHAAAEERLRIKKDQKDTERDELVNRALEAPGGAGGTKIQYREYSPAYFSDITLFLTRGDRWDPAVISKISKVKFSVTYALTTERRQ
ncbi:hypothetical protein [Nitrolancea hollandica]|uniref:Uncharacterized protein n=1 Tax=Nitrolancea hollandica Lb TaxID=1129897 RepID=I4EKB3_9BACT|nr:hypothetical protein [Nitrolancea hollandica]CCF85125.1 hypothetical protein NITHO_4510002 [Nitrolancea hollandica Lb]